MDERVVGILAVAGFIIFILISSIVVYTVRHLCKRRRQRAIDEDKERTKANSNNNSSSGSFTTIATSTTTSGGSNNSSNKNKSKDKKPVVTLQTPTPAIPPVYEDVVDAPLSRGGVVNTFQSDSNLNTDPWSISEALPAVYRPPTTHPKDLHSHKMIKDIQNGRYNYFSNYRSKNEGNHKFRQDNNFNGYHPDDNSPDMRRNTGRNYRARIYKQNGIWSRRGSGSEEYNMGIPMTNGNLEGIGKGKGGKRNAKSYSQNKINNDMWKKGHVRY